MTSHSHLQYDQQVAAHTLGLTVLKDLAEATKQLQPPAFMAMMLELNLGILTFFSADSHNLRMPGWVEFVGLFIGAIFMSEMFEVRALAGPLNRTVTCAQSHDLLGRGTPSPV